MAEFNAYHKWLGIPPEEQPPNHYRLLGIALFEKDTIKLTSLVSNVIDKDTQEKIDIVKSRLIRNFGYNEESATDVLQYVASIFARGDSKSE